MKGYIFNIQKFCLHDGPGIRTSVFFKGCNLRCKWCANPESQNKEIQITWDSRKCIGCGACGEICPRGARSPEKAHLCTACGACLAVCPAGAIGREGNAVTVEEILTEVMKDKAFYDHSGGGVTLSGGEVLLQSVFALQLANCLREKGVHVAIETAGAVPQETFASVVRNTDYVLMDLKHYDSTAHQAGTGIGNQQILANLRFLRDCGVPYLVRIPVIPAFNDRLEDAAAFAELLKELDIHQVELLPFHQLGQHKYSLLGMDYSYEDCRQLYREELAAYRDVFTRCGIEVKL